MSQPISVQDKLEQEDVICTSGVGDIDPLQPGTDPWS